MSALQRNLLILRLIPRAPSKIGTRELMTKLKSLGFAVSQRSIQRNLVDLSEIYPDLVNDGDKDIPGWFWRQAAEIQDLPQMDPPVALTFSLARQFLSQLLPPAILQELVPYFRRADNVLKGLKSHGFEQWRDRVRIVPRTQPLIPALIEDNVLHVIYEALLNRQQFKGRYSGRYRDEAEYDFHPLGLIFRDSVVYLVATVWDYEDPRHYALHRFTRAEPLEAAAREPHDFTLDSHLATGVAEYADTDARYIKLVARFEAASAQHLRETPLSEDQTLKDMRDGRVELRSTVLSTWQLRWWLLGFGENVEVMRPASLRSEFEEHAKALYRRYS